MKKYFAKLNFVAQKSAYIIIVILTVSISISISYLYRIYEGEKLKKDLENISYVVHSDDINTLTASQSDIITKEYNEILTAFVNFQNQNPKVRYIYILGLKDKQVFFFLDSQADRYSAVENKVETAVPGEVYTDVTDEFRQAIASQSVIVTKPYTDKWGTFISALAPIPQANITNVKVSIGIDREVSPNSVYYLRTGLIGLLFSIFPSLFYFYYSSSKNSRSLAKTSSTILDTISKGSDLLIMAADVNGVIISANPAAANVLEYKINELIGKNTRDMLPDNNKGECEELLHRVMAGEVVKDYQTQRLTKNGKIIDVSLTFTPIFKSGAVEKIAIVGRNITDKAEASRQLALKNQELEKSRDTVQNILSDVQDQKEKLEKLNDDLLKFKMAVANVSDHIVITDPDGFILYANAAVQKITGFRPEEITGKKAGSRELWGGLMDKSFYELMWQTIKIKKESFEGDVLNKRKNGEQYTAHAKISPVLDEKGNVIFFVGIERDVTREKEIDKMKTEFISLASHQLRTPLSAIKWFCEMLLNGDFGKIVEKQKEVLTDIYSSNQRMINLVNSLLNISRIESGRLIISPKPTEIKPFVDKVIVEVQQKIKDKKHTLTTEISEDIGIANLDPDLIRQVYLNLLTNAIKYTPEKGHIYVSVFKKGDEIVSQVSDNGYGIPQDQHSKIFDKFFRAENAVKIETDGTGLGLYLIKAIVESSGGKIWFESELNHGSSFWFSLPIKGVSAKAGEVHLSETTV